MNDIETKFNTFIGIIDREVIFMNETFDNGDGFCGATCSQFRPVSKQEVKHMNTRAYAKEYLIDSSGESELKAKFGSVAKAVDIFMAENKGEYIGGDSSYIYQNEFSVQLEMIGKAYKDIFGFVPATWECMGGGRMFGTGGINSDSKWDVLANPSILSVGLAMEAKGK